MSLQIAGNSGVVADVDGTTFRAIRVTQRPNDPGALGSYRLATISGLTTAVAANGLVFAWRWADATRVAVLKYFKVRMAVITGFTAAQELGFDVMIGRGYTANHTGGTALTLGGNNQKKRTAMGTTLIGTAADIRMATTAALGGGTITVDSNPVMAGTFKTLAAAATVQDGAYESIMDFSGIDYPFVFAQNEGIVVRNSILMGAGGTVRWAVECAWDELNSY